MEQINKLKEIYSEQLSELSNYEPGTKEYESISKVTDSLSKQIQTLERVELDSQIQADNAEIKGWELKIKEEELEASKKNNYARWIIEAVGIISAPIVYDKLLKKVTNFEKEGIYSSSASRNLLSKFKLFKK